MNIEIKENSQEFYTKSELPFDSVFAGSEGSDAGIGIHIRQATLRKVDDYLSGDKSNELGGVLIGDVCETEQGERFIKIENMIFAMHASSSLSRLTFTHDTWDYINKELEDHHSGKRIVGWFHSHPGHTVFMSSHDIFIHENFFSSTYMVAYVYDPTINERAFFKWNDGKVERAKGFCVYENDGGGSIQEIIRRVDGNEFEHELVNKKIKGGKLDIMKSIVFALSIFSLLLSGILAFNFIELNRKMQSIAEMKEEIELLNAKVDSMTPTALKEKKTTEAVKKVNEARDTSGIHTQTPEKHETAGGKQEAQINEVSQTKTGNSDAKKYTVKKGDTLERISISIYGSREAIDLIMKHNNIKDKTSIKIGQVIELPIKN